MAGELEQVDLSESPAPQDDLRADLELAFAAEPSGSPREHDATDGEDSASGAETPTDRAEPEGDAPPASWTKEAKQDWYQIPASAQAEIRRREREIQSGLSQTAEARKLSEELSPHVELMKQAGVKPADYVSNLMNWDSAIRQQPVQAIAALSAQWIPDAKSARQVVQALSERFGLDEWGEMGAAEQQPSHRDSQQIVSLEQRLRAQEMAAASREWADFLGSKDASGAPLHPFADSVKAEMADAIRSNPNLSYGEAYERAKWINAEVRDKVLAAEARARAAKGKATATRAQGMSLPRGRGGDGGVPARDDLRSELREQMARSGVRVSE